MPVKFLDLDALNKPVGEVVVAEKIYSIYPLSIKALINLSTMSDQPTDDQGQLRVQLETTLDILAEFIPDCPPETFRTLSLLQLNALLLFAREVAEEGIAKNSASPVTGTSPWISPP